MLTASVYAWIMPESGLCTLSNRFIMFNSVNKDKMVLWLGGALLYFS